MTSLFNLPSTQNMSLFYDLSNYIWPALIIFQLVVSIIALQRLGGTGPLLMVIGSGITVLRTGYNLLSNWLNLAADYSGGLPASHFVLYGFNTLGKILFLVGVLMMVNRVLKPREQSLGRTDF